MHPFQVDAEEGIYQPVIANDRPAALPHPYAGVVFEVTHAHILQLQALHRHIVCNDGQYLALLLCVEYRVANAPDVQWLVDYQAVLVVSAGMDFHYIPAIRRRQGSSDAGVVFFRANAQRLWLSRCCGGEEKGSNQ